MVISMWGQIAILLLIKDGKKGVTIKEALVKAWGKLKSYWWISFLKGFIVVGGYLLLIVPGFLFSIWFSMASFVFVSEDIKGMNALLKSREYVRGYFWAIVGRYMFWGVFSILLYWLPFLVFKALHFPSYVNYMYSIVTSIIIGPFSLVYAFLLYNNLKLIKGHFVFKPSSNNKTFFVICGMLCIIIPIILLMISIFKTYSGIQSTHSKKIPAIYSPTPFPVNP